MRMPYATARRVFYLYIMETNNKKHVLESTEFNTNTCGEYSYYAMPSGSHNHHYDHCCCNTAIKVKYNNDKSGLPANNVQDALDAVSNETTKLKKEIKDLYNENVKITAVLSPDDDVVQEITNQEKIISFTAKLISDTFVGPTKTISPFKFEEYNFINTVFKRISDSCIKTDLVLPKEVGPITSTFEVRYDGVTRSASVTTMMNLRKFFFFADGQIGIDESKASHFSNGVGCTVTIPAINIEDGQDKYRNIILAVPEDMTISAITQPDALNAPFQFTEQGITMRVIGEKKYRYKLYTSQDKIDATQPKRLTIS